MGRRGNHADSQGRSDPVLVDVHETATGGLRRRIPLRGLSETMRSTVYRTSPSLAFSGDGTQLALAITPGTFSTAGTRLSPGPREAHAFIWNVADGRELFHDVTPYPHASSLYARAAPSRDGVSLALSHAHFDSATPGSSARYRGKLRVVDVPGGRERMHVTSAEFYATPTISPDGRLVAIIAETYSVAGSNSGRLKVFDVETGQARTNFPEQAMDASLVRFSPTGLLAVIATDRNSAPNLVLCDLQAGRAVATEPLPAAFSFINVLAFSPDGRFLIIAARQGPACQVRELPSGRLVQELSLKAAGSEAIAVRSSDESLVTIDRFGNVREWDLPSARPGSLDSGRVLDQAGDVALAAGGREVVAVKEGDDSVPGGHFFIHNAATGQVLRQFAGRGLATTCPTGASVRSRSGAQGSRLALAIFKPNRRDVDHLEVWDSASGQRLLSLDADALGGGLWSPVWMFDAQALDAAGTRLAVRIQGVESPSGEGGRDVRGSGVSVVALPSGQLIRRIPGAFEGLMLSPDGRLLALGSSEVTAGGERRARIDLVDPDSGRVAVSLRGGLSRAHAIAFSPDGRRLAACEGYATSLVVADSPSRVEVWDLSAGASQAPVHLDGHRRSLAALEFSADGRRLATLAMRDGRTECEVKLWDLSNGRDLVTWPVSGGRPMGLEFDPDGRRLRVLLSGFPRRDARVILFDAAPLPPEVEAIELVDRLTGKTQLNSELAANVEAEPGVDPAVRAAALEVISRRRENCANLMARTRSWLGVAAAERTPELLRRALAYAERAAALVADLNAADLATLGETRYRNGQAAECLALCASAWRSGKRIRRCFPRSASSEPWPSSPWPKRSWTTTPSPAALDDYRARRAQASAGSAARPPDDPLLAEAEALLRDAPGVPRPPT